MSAPDFSEKQRRMIAKRLARSVVVDATTGCWKWTGSKTSKDGYGKIWLGKETPAWCSHRAAWVFYNGPIPDGQCVLHRCDNPPCVNPAHLFLGTFSDNMKDMVSKKRGGGCIADIKRGEETPGAKLTELEVSKIREALSIGEAQRSIARRFGVAQATIGDIHRGVTWRAVK